MRYLASRGLFLLLTLLGLLSLFQGSWRPVFALALCLLIVAHVCYSLLVNDSLLSPQVPAAFLQLITSFASYLYITSNLIATQSVVLYNFLGSFWNQKVIVIMKKFWNSYQLSSDADENKSLTGETETQCNENRKMSMSFNYGDSLGLTSTPLVGNVKNGGLGFTSKRNSSLFGESDSSLNKEESRLFNIDNSPWSTSNSPRMRPKASGIKTVHTVAGPLLASTRYNIDPKVYFDVTSPGLTTRLTKYATEPNNKLTHQSRYRAGQFPKVNLHASPTPVIKPNIKKTAPVTVRVAQPVASKPIQTQKKATAPEPVFPCNMSPTYQFLIKESLKRQASREDMTELAKKQRTELSYQNELGNLEEMTQKRARDDSSKSDEEASLEYKSLRPKKRTKTPSCNDIINSLSSSIHVFSGTKRKAEDNSQEFEKHFKSQSQSSSASAKDIDRSSKSLIRSKSENISQSKSPDIDEKSIEKAKEPKPIKLSDKLFMGAEPENNEKLLALIEDQGNNSSKFSLDDKDEIRKEDITLMRQTSMKARLQSMFDAISGKTVNKINPDVVIHADQIGNESTSASLSSSTITTNVNTSPITTSAVAPILKSQSPADKTGTPKHVTFSFDTTKTSTSNAQFTAPSVPKLNLPASNSSTLITPMLNFGSSASTTSTAAVTLTSSSSQSTSSSLSKAPTFTAMSSMTTAAPSVSVTTTTSTPFKFTLESSSTTATSSIITSSAATAPSVGVTSATPSFSFGKTQTTPATSKINFGVTSSSSSSGEVSKPTFSFGQSTTSAGNVPSSVPSCTTVAVPSFSFGQTSNSTSFKFGEQPSTAASSAAPALNFSQTTASTSAPMLSFGQSSSIMSTPSLSLAQNTTTTTSSSSTFSFGQTLATTSSSALPSFGQTTTTSSAPSNLFGGTKTATSESSKTPFGAPATTSSVMLATENVFSSGTAVPAFGQGNAFNAPKTTTTSLFNSTPSFTATTTATTVTNIFNAPTSSATITSPNLFGSTASLPTTTTTSATGLASLGAFKSSSSMFGMSTPAVPSFGTPATTAAAPLYGITTTTTAPVFGATTTSTPVFGATTSSAPVFGATTTNAPSVFGANTNNATPVFGATTTNTTPSFGSILNTTTAPSFGSNLTTTFASGATPTFGASTTSNTTPAFGASVVTTTSSFGSNTTSTSSAFSANETPAFNAQTSHASNFSANLNFTATSNGFDSASAQSPFGSGLAQTSAFGGTSAASNFPNGTFSFSGNATQPRPPTAQSGFNFNVNNNNNNNNTSNSSGVFQFGAGSSKPGGFSFNAPTSTPDINFGATSTGFGNTPQQPATNFTAPASQGASMFNIGTGSTAPRTRTVRDRFRRQR